MQRKVRELKADLRRAGYRLLRARGKGSHSRYAHPLVPDWPVTISGGDGDDARPYQEDQVSEALRRADEATRRQAP